jgi:uncharacterized caspase-like protein
VQVEGENFLIPVGAELTREDEVRYQAVNVGLVLSKMDSARNGTNIVILDACRDNPFRSYARSLQQGLATMDAPIGTFISYATAPGKVAADGSGKNGVYTGHLLTEMRSMGAPIELVFKRVRQQVVAETKGRQVPWEATSLQGDFYFVPPVIATATSARPPVPPTDPPAPVRQPGLHAGSQEPEASAAAKKPKPSRSKPSKPHRIERFNEL